MRPTAFPTWLGVIAALYPYVAAQTSSKCNPLTTDSCPADPALGKSTTVDFTQGSSAEFTASGNPTYSSNGVSFTIAQSGDAPTLTSNWYIMFGHVDVWLKVAPGVGIVSTLVLISDDLDEIDYEWLGADNTQVQSNYFSKGQTTTYNRGAFHPDPSNQDSFIKYSIDWTADQIVWQINGVTVRALTQASTGSQGYPQTPMQVKIGAWSAGDPSNAPGTIAWAGGQTNYANGPYTMQVKSISVTDYSTGSQYTYGDESGSWQSIKSSGGSINSVGDSGSSSADPSAPAVTAVSNGAPLPFEGTHRGSSTYIIPSVYPWVANPTTLLSSTATATTYPGLPSGWTVSSSGKVVPPSAAPTPQLTSLPILSTSSLAPLPSASSLVVGGGSNIITTYNQQGFLTVITEPNGWPTASKSYDTQGFLITPAPSVPVSSSKTTVAISQEAAQLASTSTLSVAVTKVASAASLKRVESDFVALYAFLAVILIV
ncbi:hypothetical protein MMC14_007394 [Varicellaria rhodocarpa]|nr:hypothetical protein [Varicellaria rhodocarpa]